MTGLLLFLAIVPTLVLIIFIYYKDSYEKEPVFLLLQLFILGVVSCIPVIFYELIADSVLKSIFYEENVFYHFMEAYFAVALAEEGAKYLFTYMRTWNSKQFNYKFDGIVYAVLVSLGFATFENILYVLQGGVSVAIIRALLAVPGHAIDGVFMGYHYGEAKYYDSVGYTGKRNKHLFLAILVPLLLHGFYDFCLFTGRAWSLFIFVIFIIIIDVAAMLKVDKASRFNQQIIRRNTYYNNYYAPYQNVLQWQNMNNINNVQQWQNMNNINNVSQWQNMNNAQQWQNTNRFVYCVNCGKLCNASGFFCEKCGRALQK